MTIPSFNMQVLRSLCNILGDTNHGLTGSEIAELLSSCSIDDPLPGYTKRHRLFEALHQKQTQDGFANNIVAFIQEAMNPVRHVGMQEYFESQRSALNEVLAFAGMTLGEDGKIRSSSKVSTLSEAVVRATKLKKNLQARQVHPDVLEFCREELVVENYFHAVFEATKSVAEKIRERTGLKEDGADLVDVAFAFKNCIPYLALNSLTTESERSEQRGFMNLLKGLFGMFRNTTAHVPKIKWVIEEKDALDILSMISLIHRRLDSAVDTRNVAQRI